MVQYNLGKVRGADGNGISRIAKTNTSGLIDTYTVYYTNGNTWTFNVTNGAGQPVTSWSTTPSNSNVPSEKLVKDSLDGKANASHIHDDRYYNETEIDTMLVNKQDKLTSGSNIKTINNQSLLGSGDIHISGGGSDIDIDTTFPQTPSDEHVPSTKLVKDTFDDFEEELDDKADAVHNHDDRYYTESEIDTALNGKADSTHSHGAITSDGKVTMRATFNNNYIPLLKKNNDHTVTSGEVPAQYVKDPTAYSNLNTSANSPQSTINYVVDAKIGEIEDLIGDAIIYINQ